MSSMVPPAASMEALRFSHTCRVCPSISPMPATVPSGRRAVMPEMNTSRPLASIIVAWEKWPLGWRIFADVICCLGMVFPRRQNISALRNLRKVELSCPSPLWEGDVARVWQLQRSSLSPPPPQGGGKAGAGMTKQIIDSIISGTALAGVLFVGVPIRLHRIVRSVVNLDHDGFLVRDGRPVHIALGIAVEAAGREHDPGLGVLVAARQADHELVGRMIVRRGNSGAPREPDQRHRRAGFWVPPQHFFRHTCERFFPPWHGAAVDQNFFKFGGAGWKIHSVLNRPAVAARGAARDARAYYRAATVPEDGKAENPKFLRPLLATGQNWT